MVIGDDIVHKQATGRMRRLQWLEEGMTMAVVVVEAQPDVMWSGVMNIVLTGAFACHDSIEVEDTFCYNHNVYAVCDT